MTEVSNEQSNVQKTIELRRQELVNELKTGLAQLFQLSVDLEDEEEESTYQFSTNMCLSECFRSIGYWDNQLHQSIKTIQNLRNEKVQ